jgi:Domain of unknown function (DUF4157)
VPEFANEGPSRIQRAVAEPGSAEGSIAGGVSGNSSTGALPDGIASAVHDMSHVDISATRVHYDSTEPSRIAARAFTRGDDIYLSPGQERHLPHESWHVVQQRQGRVPSTTSLRGAAVNDDPALEHEADTMATKIRRSTAALPAVLSAARPGVETRQARRLASSPAGGVVQGVFDWVVDAAHNRRKVGAEITEGKAGNNNMLLDAVPTPAWAPLGPFQKHAAWTAPQANLPDNTGANVAWRVAPAAAMAAYFVPGAGRKHDWMQWGEVMMTEDYGEYEWIIHHPPAPQGVTYYRDRLAEVAQSRAAFRAALPAVPGEYVMAMNADPAADEAIYVLVGATDAASAQFTFESTDRAKTKQVLLEGLSSGLDRNVNGAARERLADADPDVSQTVTTAAGHIAAVPGLADTELLMAYIVSDLCHKVATHAPGPVWAAAVAANFKQWRTMFPKSHPSQILYQALNGLAGHHVVTLVRNALTAGQAAVTQDVHDLVARKLVLRTVRLEWAQLDPNSLDINQQTLLSAITGTPVLPAVPVVPGPAAVSLALAAFLNTIQPNFVATEYTNAVTAMCDTTQVANNVVRSTGFAQHGAGLPGTDKGFAVEDRAEVATFFPGLESSYERIKAIVDRY